MDAHEFVRLSVLPAWANFNHEGAWSVPPAAIASVWFENRPGQFNSSDPVPARNAQAWGEYFA
jgi:hypothetical protein